jgi:hypothetical protein
VDSLEQGYESVPRRRGVAHPQLPRPSSERPGSNRHEGLCAVLPVPVLAYWVPKFRHVATLHVSVNPQHRWCDRGCCVTNTTNHLHQSLPRDAHDRCRDYPLLREGLRVERSVRTRRTCASRQGSGPGAGPIHSWCNLRMPVALHSPYRCPRCRFGPQFCPDLQPANCPYGRPEDQDDPTSDAGS